RDTGIGIPSEGMQRLFRPFTQLDSSLNRQHEGTGLGLALVRRLTDLHGGSIMVESEIDKGSSFTIALPYHTSGHSTVMLAEPALFHTRNLHSALVVEDSPNIVEQITRYLQEISIHTVVHAQGSDAIHLATTMQPGIIFLDLMMPDQSGWEILAKLKTDRQTQDIPVVIISVMDDRLRGLAAGASEYLIKPISRETLHQALYTVTHTIADDPLVTTPPPPKAPPIGARILLAEDNEVNLHAVRDYLEEKGYVVTVARTGREALEQAKEVVPDLILMDIQMPEMDGLEAIQHLRDRAESAATPIIALTALAMAGDRERCLAAGASEYLTKPVSLRGLVETMHRLLPT
ncbi:MAG: response regulator, partial [Oscillochloris sp.]|nr:response regulator [Oscillochloris sp.]